MSKATINLLMLKNNEYKAVPVEAQDLGNGLYAHKRLNWDYETETWKQGSSWQVSTKHGKQLHRDLSYVRTRKFAIELAEILMGHKHLPPEFDASKAYDIDWDVDESTLYEKDEYKHVLLQAVKIAMERG